VKEEDRPKTAFSTSSGLWEFNKMPFGLCNGPPVFSRCMEKIFSGMQWEECLIFLDDILVFGRDFNEHMERLEKVFQKLKKSGLKLKPSKCKLAQNSTAYLGHVISGEGIHTDPAKVSAVTDIKPPKTVKQARSFLGLTGYYRRFVTGFSSIASPIYALLEKNRKYVWTEGCQTAFDTLKEKLTTAPILAYPDFSIPFRLYTDASNLGIGAVLSQMQGRKERVVAYASRTLKTSEKNYETTKKECLALVWGVKHFNPYITGMKYTIFTDHKALAYIAKLKLTDSLIARWAMALNQHYPNYTIEYKEGKSMGNADGLSRLPQNAKPEDEEEEILLGAVNFIEETHEYFLNQLSFPEIR
jgi:hypothetical protein